MLSRRAFLSCVTVTAAASALPGLARARGARRTARAGFGARSLINGDVFPQSVASGDPSPDSVILWTRVVDPAAPGDLPVQLEVASDPEFESLVVDTELSALAVHGGCIRVKVVELAPATHYYYRFTHVDASGPVTSNAGRTKTAPDPSQDVPVRFAHASCQDYIGRYYNPYLGILTIGTDDLDFVVHLGDFIYETNGDPLFQSTGGERVIDFDDLAGAIELSSLGQPYFAASSLSNYRQLYQVYRADPVLQEVLEKFPLIAIWDDHEFSNDCFGDNATYTSGAAEEKSTERKRNAETAWLEYLPIDDDFGDALDGDILSTAPEKLFPQTRIYRTLRYGRHLNLVLTDFRTFRPDHLVPEDAFPAAVIASQAQLEAKYLELGLDFAADLPSFRPYVLWEDLSPSQQGTVRAAVEADYESALLDAGLDPAEAAEQAVIRADQVLAGRLDAQSLNQHLPRKERLSLDGLEVGLSYLMLNKTSLFSAFGSRFGVVQRWFDLLATLGDPADEEAHGAAQQQFIDGALDESDATWNVLLTPVTKSSVVVDLSGDSYPEDCSASPEDPFCQLSANMRSLLRLLAATPLGQRYYFSLDQWDGFPTKRSALLADLAARGNVVVLSGDIHASLVTDHSAAGGPLFEFTGTAISSTTIGAQLRQLIQVIASMIESGEDPTRTLRRLAAAKMIPQEVIDAIVLALLLAVDEVVKALDTLVIERSPRSDFFPGTVPELIAVDSDRNGVMVVDVGPERFDTTYLLLPPADVQVSHYDSRSTAVAKLLANMRTFTVEGGVLSETTPF